MAKNPFVYQDVFGGSNIYPSDISYAPLTLTQDVTYSWPLESSPSTNNLLLPRILQVTANNYKTTPGYQQAGVTANVYGIGNASILVNGASGLKTGIYVSFGTPPTNTNPTVYLVIGYVAFGTSAYIVLNPPLSANYAAGTSVWVTTISTYGITLPDATQAGVGQTLLVVSGQSSTAYFNVYTSGTSGTNLLTVPPGTAWQTYITDNSTQAGTWASFQYGAGLSAYQTSGLAGNGLTLDSNKLATALPVNVFNVSPRYSAGNADRAQTYVWTSASGQFILPVSTAVRNNWFVIVRNQGTGVLAITPTGFDKINAQNTGTPVNLDPGDSAIVVTDGLGNFYTIGYGRAISSIFDYTVINPTQAPATTWSGTYNLAITEQNRISYSIQGQLSAAGTIVVPQYAQQYWISNDTTGPYTLTIKTSNVADTGIVVNQGKKAIYYSNGSTLQPADNNGISFPIAVALGGTGATTADGAILNLNGGASVGAAIFKASDAATALAAMGTPTAILNYLGGNLYTSTVGLSLLNVNNAMGVASSDVAAGSIAAMGGASAVNSVLGAASIGDVLALAVALG